jgi:GIY-YIG catalytic domain
MSEKIEKYLSDLELQLLDDNNRRIIQTNKEWLKIFPSEAGVYLLREEGNICYVGETGNLQSRMRDFLDTRNHSVRRKIGEIKFSNEAEYQKGSSSHKFPEKIETELNNVLEDNFEISTVVVPIGRKELEERIVNKYKPIYNVRDARKSPEKSYAVEEIRKTHEKAYLPWTTEEDNQLWELKQSGYSIGELAGAINSRLVKLEFKHQNK